MAYFAKLDENNLVLEVHSVANEALDSTDEENSGIAFLTDLLGYSNWKQTSFNGRIRKQYCGVGYSYNPEADVFVAPQPFASWSLDDNYDWQPPVAYPTDGQRYSWNESKRRWDAIEL
jgi:hypothetical protein